MRILLLLGMTLSACMGGCGPKPLKEMSSKGCVNWVCPQDSGKGECKCADK
jgi:hypothetical protein